MGMPISNYTVFKALTDKSNRFEFELASECFRDFNLFAFVIYDPDKHKEFYDKLSNTFNVLDRSTGDKLLFFAVCNIPKNWDEKVTKRSYSGIYNWSKEQFTKYNKSNMNLHNSEAAAAIAKSFNLETDNLPCIIVTNNFESGDYCWFKTCPQYIENQLNNLGYIADEYPFLKYEWINAKEIMTDRQHNVNLCDSFGYDRLSVSLAEALSQVLAFLESVCSQDPYIRNRAKKDLPNVIKKLREDIKIIKVHMLKNEYNIEENQIFDELNLKLASLINILNISPRDVPDCISACKNYMEDDSYNNIRLGNNILELFDSHNINYLFKDGEKQAIFIDYTPSIICFSKAFEREIGLSFGHTVRKYVRVSLPKYYNKYDNILGKNNGKIMPDASLVQNPKQIEFNNGKNGKWIAPGIGQMRLAFKTLELQNNDDINKFIKLIDEPDKFLELWKCIADERNACAHTEYMTNFQAHRIKGYIESIASNNIFQILYNAKMQYKV